VIARHLPRLPTLLSNESREGERENGGIRGSLDQWAGLSFFCFSPALLFWPRLCGLGVRTVEIVTCRATHPASLATLLKTLSSFRIK
jgi:hypothetical protein